MHLINHILTQGEKTSTCSKHYKIKQNSTGLDKMFIFKYPNIYITPPCRVYIMILILASFVSHDYFGTFWCRTSLKLNLFHLVELTM